MAMTPIYANGLEGCADNTKKLLADLQKRVEALEKNSGTIDTSRFITTDDLELIQDFSGSDSIYGIKLSQKTTE